MPSSSTLLFLFVFIFAICLSESGVYAFGAGNIPSFGYMEGRAFRHGDIEDTLADLFKKGAGGGFALANLISKGSKFNGLDIKRVYFGNWLRDYSQAVDIAGLQKMSLQTIINLCMVLGFLANGYATHEFEVTAERLGVYLPTEHIDNPKGYGNGEDARKYHPQLRGPVDPVELQIDPRTGMKNYIANDTGHWDTSRALVRRTLEKCIHLGRQHRARGDKKDEYEAYRLLGQALHTLEDFPAHSNFCEIALVSMGHTNVFMHVGDQVRIQAPNGKWVAPIVTGTFGSSDFIHSLLGEATDHISQASVSDLNRELDKARAVSSRSGPGGSSDPAAILRDLFFSIPGGSGSEMTREMEGIERIRAGPAQGGKKPEDMSPQELHAVLWQVLSFRDSVVKKISKTIEKIPGLGPLIEKIMDSISVFVFTTLEPFLKPLMKTATSGLQSASGEVIDNRDQYEVFDDPRASDPTHSFLSKDHFNLILNETAGHLAKIIVIHTVMWVTKAWDDTSVNVHQLTDDVLECIFHPDFHNSNSKIQREMLQYMRTWLQGLGHNQHSVLQRLTKESVRHHKNIRLAGEGGKPAAEGTFAYNEGIQVQHDIQGYLNHIPGVSQAQSLFGGGPPGSKRDIPNVQPGYPGATAHGPHPPHHDGHSVPTPISPSGEAASFFGGGPQSPHQTNAFPGAPGRNDSYPAPPGPPGRHDSYPAPPGPPGRHDSYPATTPSGPPGPIRHDTYPAPPGPPYSAPPGPPPGRHDSYSTPPGPPTSFPGSQQPSYSPSYNSPPPSFPGGPAPSFPGGLSPSFPGEARPAFPEYGNPYSSPSAGGYGPPPGGFPTGGPGFPGADPYGANNPSQFPQQPGQPGGYPPPGGSYYGGAPPGW